MSRASSSGTFLEGLGQGLAVRRLLLIAHVTTARLLRRTIGAANLRIKWLHLSGETSIEA